MTEITIPYGVKEIGKMAFGGCYKLQTVYLPDGLVNVDLHAFINCSCTMTLPESAIFSVNETLAYASNLDNCSFAFNLSCVTKSENNFPYVYSISNINFDDNIKNHNKIDMDGNVILNIPYRKGYTFLGWTTKEGSMLPEFPVVTAKITKTYFSRILWKDVKYEIMHSTTTIKKELESAEDKTYYAVWIKN